MADMPTPFPGRIGRTLAESEPFWSEPPHPGDEAPNVVVVLLVVAIMRRRAIATREAERSGGNTRLRP